MITLQVTGGLGNQMFEYAAARALSLRHKTGLILDTTPLSHRLRKFGPAYAFRPFGLSHLNVPVRRTLLSRLAAYPGLGNICYLAQRLLTEAAELMRPGYVVREASAFAYRSLDARAGKSAYLMGYFQSPRYFEGVREEILSEFTLRHPWSGAGEELRAKIRRTAHSTSLHIRRGDYVTNEQAKAFHGTCDIAYYERAIALLHGQLQGSALEIFVFSDDIPWARENLRLPFPVHFASRPEIPDYEEMRLMSECVHHIIANSSFSWWGAWLDRKSSSITIAPAHWAAGKPTQDTDILPPSWMIA